MKDFMEKQFKLFHNIVRRMGDLIAFLLVLACILFATRGF